MWTEMKLKERKEEGCLKLYKNDGKKEGKKKKEESKGKKKRRRLC